MATNRLFIYDPETKTGACIAKGYSTLWSAQESIGHLNDFFEIAHEVTGGLSETNPTRLELRTEDNLPSDAAIFYAPQ